MRGLTLPGTPSERVWDITAIEVSALPDCEPCYREGRSTPAFADARLWFGSWAFVCVEHFDALGCRLRRDYGQQLILRSET